MTVESQIYVARRTIDLLRADGVNDRTVAIYLRGLKGLVGTEKDSKNMKWQSIVPLKQTFVE